MSEPQDKSIAPFTGKQETLADLLKKDAYRNRFEQVLGERAPQFISSILSLGSTMRDVEPKSVLAASIVAASLDLPIDKNLGFAWIVPYKKGSLKLAQFQMGYKGYIQLAQRTAAYARMNAEAVNGEAYKGRDDIGDPIIDWNAVDPAKPIAGYVFAFRLVNGFTKLFYWSKAKVEAHAQRYSQAYRGGYETPWKTHFDSMALKTVIANELRKWGLLSVQMQGAFSNDQTIRRDIDVEAEFPDAATDDISRPQFEGDEKEEAAAGLAPEQPKGKSKGTKAAKAKAEGVQGEGASSEPHKLASPGATPGPASTPSMEPVQGKAGNPEPIPSDDAPVIDKVLYLCGRDGINETEVLEILKRRRLATKELEQLVEVNDMHLADVIENWEVFASQVRMDRRAAKKA